MKSRFIFASRWLKQAQNGEQTSQHSQSVAREGVYMEDAEGKEYVRLYPTKAAALADVGTNLDVHGVANFRGCLAEYDLSPQTETTTKTNTYGTLTDTRIGTYHYCFPD